MYLGFNGRDDLKRSKRPYFHQDKFIWESDLNEKWVFRNFCGFIYQEGSSIEAEAFS